MEAKGAIKRKLATLYLAGEREILAFANSESDLPHPILSALHPYPPPSAQSGDAQKLLNEIRADIGDCTRCRLSEQRRNIVFGVGNPSADLMFIGEAPGRDEDLQGEPFVGRAGQLLTKI